MKRLLVFVCCVVALAMMVSFNATRANVYAQDSQAKIEAPNLDVYIGKYEVAPNFILTITNEKNKLMGQPTGDAKIEFKAETEADKFSSSQENVQLKFVRDETGAVTSVIVTLDGKPYPSKKIK